MGHGVDIIRLQTLENTKIPLQEDSKNVFCEIILHAVLHECKLIDVRQLMLLSTFFVISKQSAVYIVASLKGSDYNLS